jgi:hypothetical protein
METPEKSQMVMPDDTGSGSTSTETSAMETDAGGQSETRSAELALKLKEYLEKVKSKKTSTVTSDAATADEQHKLSDGTYSAISVSRLNKLKCHDLNGGTGGTLNPQIGTFYNKGDFRVNTCTVRSIFTADQNISYSFDPENFVCVSCTGSNAHVVAGSGTVQNDRAVFVLSDQCFPAALPSKTGKCIPVMRIEYGGLMELARSFIDLMAGSSLPVGSVVIVSSASQLADIGVAGYAEEMVRCSRLLLQSFSNAISVRHGVSVLLGGAENPGLIRALAELDAWLSSLPGLDSFPKNSRKAALLALRNSGSGNQEMYPMRLRLPISLTSFEKKTWSSSGWEDLPRTVAACSAPDEHDIIHALLSDLAEIFSLQLPGDVSLDRASKRPLSSSPTCIVVGASNAGRLSDMLLECGATVHHVKMPSWKPTAATVEAAVKTIEAIEVDSTDNTMIIFYNLDCAAYYARTESGDLLPARQLEGHYHVDGALVLAPREMFTYTLECCTPLLMCHPSVRKLILSPTPRYWVQPCCSSPGHVTNFANTDFEEKLFGGLDALRRITKDFIFLKKIPNTRVLNPVQIFAGNSSPTTTTEVITEVKSLWGSDPVHPGTDCFLRLAEFILEEQVHPNLTTTLSSKRHCWSSSLPATSVSPIVPSETFGRGRARGGRGGPRGRAGWRGKRRPHLY